MSVGVSVQASASLATQKLPTCIPLSTSHVVTPSGSSVHLPNSNLSIQLKPIAPQTPLVQIRQDAGITFGSDISLTCCLNALCLWKTHNTQLLFFGRGRRVPKSYSVTYALLVVVISSLKIPKAFLIRSITKLCLHIRAHIPHRSTGSDFQLTQRYCFCDQSSFHVMDFKLDIEPALVQLPVCFHRP